MPPRRALITALACGFVAAPAAADVVIIVLGPDTPDAHSTPGMHMKITPKKGVAGTEFKARARGFASGEYVTVWEYTGKHHSSQLNGGNANRHGRITIYPQTAAGVSAAGKRKLCAQGERSRRVACASFRVTDAPDSQPGGDDQAGDGYTPPTSDGDFQPPTSG